MFRDFLVKRSEKFLKFKPVKQQEIQLKIAPLANDQFKKIVGTET